MTKFIWLLAEQGIYQALVTAEVVQLVCWKSEKEEKQEQFGVLSSLSCPECQSARRRQVEFFTYQSSGTCGGEEQ